MHPQPGCRRVARLGLAVRVPAWHRLRVDRGVRLQGVRLARPARALVWQPLVVRPPEDRGVRLRAPRLRVVRLVRAARVLVWQPLVVRPRLHRAARLPEVHLLVAHLVPAVSHLARHRPAVRLRLVRGAHLVALRPSAGRRPVARPGRRACPRTPLAQPVRERPLLAGPVEAHLVRSPAHPARLQRRPARTPADRLLTPLLKVSAVRERPIPTALELRGRSDRTPPDATARCRAASPAGRARAPAHPWVVTARRPVYLARVPAQIRTATACRLGDLARVPAVRGCSREAQACAPADLVCRLVVRTIRQVAPGCPATA
ncbi:hypothetical protein [Lentzea sp. NPDC092896]|uniref:hypothetical protein n=1 Tax=Lentzea sp. NPDC092896 TaxID=3364127 RepID=UPI0038004998